MNSRWKGSRTPKVFSNFLSTLESCFSSTTQSVITGEGSKWQANGKRDKINENAYLISTNWSSVCFCWTTHAILFWNSWLVNSCAILGQTVEQLAEIGARKAWTACRFHLSSLEGAASGLARLWKTWSLRLRGLSKLAQALAQRATAGRTSPDKLEAAASMACSHHTFVPTLYMWKRTVSQVSPNSCLYSVFSTSIAVR